MSVGLEQSGIMDTEHSYAVEYDSIIAEVYRRNHKNKQTFTDGVGEFLFRSEVGCMRIIVVQ